MNIVFQSAERYISVNLEERRQNIDGMSEVQIEVKRRPHYVWKEIQLLFMIL